MLSSAEREKILSEEILLFKNMDKWNAVAALLGGGGIWQVIYIPCNTPIVADVG